MYVYICIHTYVCHHLDPVLSRGAGGPCSRISLNSERTVASRAPVLPSITLSLSLMICDVVSKLDAWVMSSSCVNLHSSIECKVQGKEPLQSREGGREGAREEGGSYMSHTQDLNFDRILNFDRSPSAWADETKLRNTACLPSV